MKFLKYALGYDASTMGLRTEAVAGATTFLTMCYILAVNPAIIATTGMDKGALFTGTAVAAAIATLLLAFMAKLPFAQAPGMGLNAFFAFTMCQAMHLTWQQSLAALLIEGVIFVLITFLNIREMILESIPQNLRYSISAGIGMFIAFIGLKNAGIIVSNPDTYVALGQFTPEAMLGIVAIMLSGVLMARRIKGALFLAIILTTAVGIPMGVTTIPDGWAPVSMPHSMAPVFCQFDFNGMFNLNMVIVVFSLLIVNIFDSLGTLVGLAEKVGIVRSDGSIPRIKQAMMSDAIGTTASSLFGCTTITTYVESASGIAEGGRSGLTSFVTGVMFLLALFLAPLFLLIPAAATSGALVMVGVLMLEVVKKIDFTDVTESFPAFITMISMVLCYSISDGICLGMLSYLVMKVCTMRLKQVTPTLLILSVVFILKFMLG